MKKLTWLHTGYFLFSALLLTLFLSSCKPTKKLTDKQLLLTKNIVSVKSIAVDKGEIESYIKQKPNRKMLFWRFYLQVYNSVNQKKMEKKKEKRNARIDTINAHRIER